MLAVSDKLIRFGKKHLNYLIDYFYPPSCICCFNLTLTSDNLCNECFNKLNFVNTPMCKICGYAFEYQFSNELICANCINNPPSFIKARHLLKFDEYSKTIIHAFKYYDNIIFATYFAKLFYNRYIEDIHDADIITCVPMNRLKRLFRKYNPAQVLAKEFSMLVNKLFIPNLLVKTKWTTSQTKLTKKQREYNIKNSLVFNDKYNISNKKILLIDDVSTTKSTITMCSSLLKKNGANAVYVFVVAATYKNIF